MTSFAVRAWRNSVNRWRAGKWSSSSLPSSSSPWFSAPPVVTKQRQQRPRYDYCYCFNPRVPLTFITINDAARQFMVWKRLWCANYCCCPTDLVQFILKIRFVTASPQTGRYIPKRYVRVFRFVEYQFEAHPVPYLVGKVFGVVKVLVNVRLQSVRSLRHRRYKKNKKKNKNKKLNIRMF